MKKLFKISLLMLIIMMITTICLATEDDLFVTSANGSTEKTATEDAEEIPEDSEIYEQYLEYLSKFQQGDLFECNDEVTVEKIVDGNVYIIGETIVFDESSQIGGNIFLIGKNVQLSNPVAYGSIYVVAENLTVDTQAYDLYACASKIKLNENSLFARDVRIVGETAEIYGQVQGNIYSDVKKVIIGDNAEILGNINYANEIVHPDNMDESKLVKTESIFKDLEKEDLEEKGNSIKDSFLKIGLVIGIVTYITIIILLVLIMPKAEQYETDIKSNCIKDILLGLLLLIVFPIACIILCITVIGSVAGLIGLLLYFITLFIFAIPAALVEISKLILGSRATSKGKIIVVGLGLSAILQILECLPYTFIISLILALYGLGFIFRKLFIRKKCKCETKNVEKEQEETIPNYEPETPSFEDVKPEELEEVIEENSNEETDKVENTESNDDDNKEE